MADARWPGNESRGNAPPRLDGNFAVSALLDAQRGLQRWPALAVAQPRKMRARNAEPVAELFIGKPVRESEALNRVVGRRNRTGHMFNVTHSHNEGNSQCARFALKSSVPLWHPSGMAKVKRKPNHFIKEWRTLHAKISQEVAADRMGYERSYVSKVENGDRRYDEPFLEAAAKVYGCKPADLIGRHPPDAN